MAGDGNAAMDVRLLGPVEVVVGERVLALGGRKQRALLALLALEPGRALSVDMLADELWNGDPPPGATTTLRSYSSRLRRALGPDAVVARGHGYALETAAEGFDVYRFERMLRQGREALARGAAGLAADHLRAALALWRGPALADVADGGRLALEARRLDELRLVCLEERIEADLILGRHATLVAELEVLVEQEPFHERLWRQLVLALYRSDRQAEALAAYRRAQDVLAEEHGLDPSEELSELERAILRHEVEAVPREQERHNLPASLTSFRGRESELEDIERLLRDHRLITLTGVGGTGKTRLALETAGRQLARWSDGVWLVDLTASSDPGFLPGAVARTLGVGERPDTTVSQVLVHHLRRSELLLVLDNCEHLVDASRELVEALLGGCPNVRVLATSRIPLGVHGEIDYSVDPLAIPPEGATSTELERSPAVQLFLDRALAVRRDLAAPPAALATVGRICRDVDGLPLSIELAAARAKGFALSEIAARLGDRFRFLHSWRRVADPRHQSLHATMDWSYELLRPAQQRAFARLSVFAGGFTAEAAEAVCGVGIDALIELVEHSLLRSLPIGRYTMFETVQEYARERLDATGEADELDRCLLAYLLRITDRPHLEGFPGEEEWLRRVEAERANIRRSLSWALTVDPVQALRLATDLERFWVIRDHVEGFHWVSEALSRATTAPPALRAAALRCLGDTLFWTRDKERSAKAWEESLALFRQLAEVPNVAAILDRLAGAQLRLGRLEDARASAEESLALYEAIGDRRGALYTLGTLGRIEWRSGDPGRGAELIRESLARAHQFGDAWWETYHLHTLAELSLERGHLDEADRLCRRSLEIALRIDNRWTVVSCIALLAASAQGAGDVERAGRLWGGLVALERAGDPPVDPALASRFQVGASPDAAVAAGRVMDAADVIAFALGN